MKHSPQKLKVPCTVRRSQRKHKLPPDSRSDPVATDHNDGHEKSVTPDLNLHATKSISKESRDNLWIPNLVDDKQILNSDRWLNDNIIYAAEKLLGEHTKEKRILGWQSPQCAKTQFKPVQIGKYVQIQNVYE